MNRQEIIDLTKEILVHPTVGYLATISEEGFPEIRAVENFRCPEIYNAFPANFLTELDEDPLTIYFSTNTSSEKMKQLKKNNNVAVYFCIPKEFKGVMFQGKMEVIKDMDFKKKFWFDECLQFYPLGPEDPDFTILKMKPKRLKAWFKGKHEVIFSEQ